MAVKHFTLIRLRQDSSFFFCSVPAKEKSRVQGIKSLGRNRGTCLVEGVKTWEWRVMNTVGRPDLCNAAPLFASNFASPISIRSS